MTKRMLIDTTHAEETRVVVMDGDRLEEYDVETAARKQLKGNIYLAKVIRVEPSLQAAFVEYGGNRHGFLAFSEIHPDYFQIPVADRERLLALQEEDARDDLARTDAERAEPAEHDEPAAEGDADADSADQSFPEMVGGENDTGDEAAAARRMARFLRAYKIQEVIRRRQILLVQVVKEERGNKGAALTTYISLAGRYCVLMPNALRGGGVSRKITSESDRKRLREIISALDLPRGMAMIVRTAGAQRPGPEITRDCEYLLQLWDDIRSHTLSSVAPALIYEEASLIKRAIRDLYSKDIEEILIDGEPAWKSAREFMRLLMPHNVNHVKLWREQAQSLFARYQVEGMLDAMFSPTAQLKSGGYLVINQTEALVSIDVNSGRSTSQRNIEETALRTNLEAAEEVARQLRLRDLAGLIVIDFIDMESRKHNTMVEKRLKDALRSDRARIQVGSISHFGLLEMSRQRLRPSLAESVLTPCPHCQGTGFIRGTESAALHVLRAIDDEGVRQKAAEIEVLAAPGVAFYILNNKRGWLGEIEQRHRMHVVFKPDDALMPSEVKIERLRPQTESAPVPQTTIPTAMLAGPSEPSVEILDEPEALDAGENEAVAQDETSGEAREENGRRRRRRRRRGRDRDRRPEQNGGEAFADGVDETGDSTPDDEATVEPHAVAEENIVPGRRRTRFRRANRDESETGPEEAPQAEPRRETRRSSPAPRGWTGPTPADPFAGAGFDIFDVIEQAENAQELFEPSRAERTGRAKKKAAPAAPVEAVEPEPAARTPVEEPPVAVMVEEKAPVRRRGRPRKDESMATVAPVAEVPVVETAAVETPVAEQAPKPARRGRPRKAVAETAAEDVPTPTADVPTVTDEAPAQPRRRGRPRKAAAPAAEPEAAAEAAGEEAPAITPIDVDEVAPAERRVGWWRR
ncbi:ribonuclease E/G [Acidomonas methanolica]|uniref:Ribonuclease E n=2 Tax=Acidomonas methanolica TaxID=437 RepID=A0A023D941_ACIMT|nr:ribonuclease E/G [Acidomonas methanolica]MBU2654434.1 Rne/Rng family ribonuclease [Acidomonas methanolica]TCS28236.1 ribonuclease E [Acidomonas methanolica]GAJ30667.1 ribonuclease E [Acidomonas methanolica NBRC 104435]GEL00557.1 ribonuclease E [Acidomonas methanolica NBRC 104435]